MHFTDLLEEFVIYCRAANRSPQTIRWYGQYARDFSAFLTERRYSQDCDDITPRIIREYIADLQERNAPPTVAGKVRALKGLYTFAVSEDLVTSNPMTRVPIPKIPQVDFPVLDPAQVDTLLRACNMKSVTGMRDFAIVMLLFDSGVRASELIGLAPDDVDWERGFIKVLGKGAKERHVPVSTRTLRSIRRYLTQRNRDGYLAENALFLNNVGDPLTYSGLSQLLRRLSKRTGIAVRAHGLRHSFAVNALRNDAREFDIQDILGHTTLHVTKIYARQTRDDLARRHKRFSPADRLKVRI